MEIKPQTSKEYFRTLLIIFIALVFGQVSFAIVAYFINSLTGINEEMLDIKKIFLVLVPVFVVGGYLGGRLLFKRTMNTAKKKDSLVEKMNDYRSALILLYAFLEGPSMFAIVAYLLTGNLIFLGIAVFIIAIFITLAPSKDHAIRDLELNLYEEQKLLDPDSVIAEIKIGK